MCGDGIQFPNSDAQFANVVDGLFQLPLDGRPAVVQVRHILKGVAVTCFQHAMKVLSHRVRW